MKKKPINTTKQAQEQPTVFLAEMMGNGAIERQEARGQRELVVSEVLPTNYNGDKKKDFEKIGIKFGEVCEGDPMFQEVTLPDGWKKVRTDHSMWSDLVDDKGRKRAGIFYKAAFYDRSAHINLVRRFSTDTYKYNDKGVVLDGGQQELFECKHNGEYESRELARHDCEQWLKEHYPDWKDATAYWND
jgi:hypothetical protein